MKYLIEHTLNINIHVLIQILRQLALQLLKMNQKDYTRVLARPSNHYYAKIMRRVEDEGLETSAVLQCAMRSLRTCKKTTNNLEKKLRGMSRKLSV